jgi:acetoin:2,6-dichlorophenolindophenol oxidoreductase subunit alpha
MSLLTDVHLLEIHRLLLMARRLEESFGGMHSYHPALGEEAIVVGSFFGLQDNDYIAPHYRGALTAAYIRGADLRRLIAGVHGKATAYNGGRFRGDICMPIEFNVIGMFSGILGSSVGLAVGAALSLKLRGSSNVAIATFGEGTSNLGGIHEAINLAASLVLPIVFVCQNNQYAMSMNSREAMKCKSVADRALGYGIPGAQVDGNDVLSVHAEVQAAVQRARSGAGPTLIEALTYRVGGHRSGERVLYQDAEERQRWQGRDPLLRLQDGLKERGLLDEPAIEDANIRVSTELKEAISLAEADPEPPNIVGGPEDVFAPSVKDTP